MNVLHVITKSEVGGAQTWVRDQIKLFKDDFNHFIVTNESGWLTDNIKVKATLFEKKLESRFSIVTLIKILSFIKKNKIDLIIASSANAGLYSRLLKLFISSKIIYVSHGWSCLYNGGKLKNIFVFIEKVLSYFSDAILCVSERDLENAKNKIGITPDKLVCIRNSVFPQTLSTPKTNINFFKVLFLGRLASPKRVDLLIDSVREIENINLDIIGNGPLMDSYATSENVKFLGEIQNFNKFSDYDIFILLSDSEGMPMAALEAASSGLPMILSNVGGCPELIKKNGILVENNLDSVKHALSDIMNNYKTYSHNALLCASQYDLLNQKKYYLDLYQSSKL